MVSIDAGKRREEKAGTREVGMSWCCLIVRCDAQKNELVTQPTLEAARIWYAHIELINTRGVLLEGEILQNYINPCISRHVHTAEQSRNPHIKTYNY